MSERFDNRSVGERAVLFATSSLLMPFALEVNPAMMKLREREFGHRYVYFATLGAMGIHVREARKPTQNI